MLISLAYELKSCCQYPKTKKGRESTSKKMCRLWRVYMDIYFFQHIVSIIRKKLEFLIFLDLDSFYLKFDSAIDVDIFEILIQRLQLK